MGAGTSSMAWQLDFRRRQDDLTRTRDEVCDISYTASTLGRELATKIGGQLHNMPPDEDLELTHDAHQTLPSNGRLVC